MQMQLFEIIQMQMQVFEINQMQMFLNYSNANTNVLKKCKCLKIIQMQMFLKMQMFWEKIKCKCFFWKKSNANVCL